MDWLASTIGQLAAQPVIGYAPTQTPATEPTALAALALIAAGHAKQAAAALDFLVECQGTDGSVGIRKDEPSPGWPTSLAVLAWRAADDAARRNKYRSFAGRGIDWILAARGTTLPTSPEMGHNTQLVAWSWADKTHSWIEPTALHVLALKKSGLATHARVREGVTLLLDRLLPSGGCNYGNTVVLGQTLRPHVQPTGLAMLALAGESPQSTVQSPKSAAENSTRESGSGTRDFADRIHRSLAYLSRSLVPPMTATSLAWALLGLRAHGINVPAAAELLAAAYARVQSHDRSPHKLALLALEAQDTSLPLFITGT
jgi:hypothetical protein